MQTFLCFACSDRKCLFMPRKLGVWGFNPLKGSMYGVVQSIQKHWQSRSVAIAAKGYHSILNNGTTCEAGNQLTIMAHGWSVQKRVNRWRCHWVGGRGERLIRGPKEAYSRWDQGRMNPFATTMSYKTAVKIHTFSTTGSLLSARWY